MIENARRFLRQRLGSIGLAIALVALVFLAGLPLSTGQQSGFTTTLAVFILASGIVSRDAASGALQMILSRPVLRVEYLLGRFGGAVALLTIFVGGAVAVGFVLDKAAALAHWNEGPGFAWKAALVAALHDWTHGILVIATLLFFSTFLRGFGDVLAFVMFGLIFSLLPQIGAAIHQPVLQRLSAAFFRNFSPILPLDDLLRGRILGNATGAYALALAAYLLAAALVFSRREFSYGTD